jgi:hypothetical protein
MIGPGSFKIVAIPGTAVPLSATSQRVAFVTFFPRQQSGNPNVGEVRLGGLPTAPAIGIPSGSGMRLSPGDSGVAWPIQSTNGYDLAEIYLDADNANDGIQFVWGAP